MGGPTMETKTLPLLLLPLVLAGPSPVIQERVLDRRNPDEPTVAKETNGFKPGKPLGPADFEAASKLPIHPRNEATDEMMKMVSYGEVEGLKHTGGIPDLADVVKSTKNGIHALENHWGSGIVPYTIDASFSDSDRAVIAQGIKHTEDNSCLRFVPRNGEHDYVQIWPGPENGGCYAVIPYRIGSGMREIGLNPNGCMTMYVVVHEILHIVGVKHEQCRPDRDDFINIDWSNICDDGESQYYKDNWVGDAAPTNLCKETKDYPNCNSPFFTSACDLPYDYASVMHYSARSFACDRNKDVMTAKQSGAPTLGNTELSELDKQKLQCMYQCDGTEHSNCGGHFYGESGTFSSDGTAGCEWLIRAPVGKGIILDFGSIPGGVSCSDVTIEVRKGVENKDDASGPLFGSYCSSSNTLVINTRSAAVRVKITMASGAIPKGTNFGQWTTEDLTCCDKVMMENLDGQTSSMGIYTKMTDGTTSSEVPVYKNNDGSAYLFLSPDWGTWIIADSYTTSSTGVKSSNGDFCPEDGVGWQYYGGGGWTTDSDAGARCSDCDLYPANSECITCCDTLKIETTSSNVLNSGYGVFAGTYNLHSSTPSYNDQKVYQLSGQNYVLYYDCGRWQVSSGVGGCGGFVWSSNAPGCAHNSDLSWEVAGGIGADSNMKETCDGECAGDAPAAPSGASSSGSGKAVGTIITYTCNSVAGKSSKAICDAATLAWKPTSIPSDLCSAAAPSPVPSPSPSPSPTGPTPCQQKNKIPVLKGPKKEESKNCFRLHGPLLSL